MLEGTHALLIFRLPHRHSNQGWSAPPMAFSPRLMWRLADFFTAPTLEEAATTGSAGLLWLPMGRSMFRATRIQLIGQTSDWPALAHLAQLTVLSLDLIQEAKPSHLVFASAALEQRT